MTSPLWKPLDVVHGAPSPCPFAVGMTVALWMGAFDQCPHSLDYVGSVAEDGSGFTLQCGTPFAITWQRGHYEARMAVTPELRRMRTNDPAYPTWMRRWGYHYMRATPATDAHVAAVEDRDARAEMVKLCEAVSGFRIVAEGSGARYLTAAEVCRINEALRFVVGVVPMIRGWQRGRGGVKVRRKPSA